MTPTQQEEIVSGMANDGGSWIIHRWRCTSMRMAYWYLSVCGSATASSVTTEDVSMGIKRCKRCFRAARQSHE